MTDLAAENVKFTNALRYAAKILGHDKLAVGPKPASEAQQHLRLRQALREAVRQMRAIAEPVGSMHGYWDDIGDFEALLSGGQPRLDWSVDHTK